ncbi:mitochondrial carrier domain-containing protein [Lactarius quietus]|nr:mitochondrial carrier domain-containing protein [Lactarius quietus]
MSDVGQHLLSGALSGLTSSLFLQPCNLLPVRSRDVLHLIICPQQHGAIRSTARAIVSSSGVYGLWRGTSATLIRCQRSGIALYMTGLNQARGFMADPERHSSVLPVLTSSGNLLAGATTRVAFSGFLHAVNHACGTFELFRGFLASSLRDAPTRGIKHEAASILPPSSHLTSAALHSGSAAAAGTIATLATHPFDVIKVVMAVWNVSIPLRSTFHTLILFVSKERGINGFFDGASLRLSRKILSSAIGWAVYESLLVFVRTRNEQKSSLYA